MRFARSRSTRAKLRSYFRGQQRMANAQKGWILVHDFIDKHHVVVERQLGFIPKDDQLVLLMAKQQQVERKTRNAKNKKGSAQDKNKRVEVEVEPGKGGAVPASASASTSAPANANANANATKLSPEEEEMRALARETRLERAADDFCIKVAAIRNHNQLRAMLAQLLHLRFDQVQESYVAVDTVG